MLEKFLDYMTLKRINRLLLVALIISLIPILGLALYGYPSADDFSASDSVRMAWLESGSILEVVKAAWQNTIFNYLEWSGVYASVFWTSLQPGIFGEQWYGITAWIAIILLTCSAFYLSHIVFHTYLKANKCASSCITILYLLLIIHCMPDGNEGIYWHAGVVNYTWAFCFFVYLIGLVLSLYQENNPKKKIVKFVLAILMAIFVGGGNYITALQGNLVMMLISVSAIIINIIYKKQKISSFVKENIMALLPSVIIVVAFAVSVLAPGNKVRMSESQGMNPIEAIVNSFLYAIKFPIQEWLKWPVVLLLLASIPFMTFLVSRTVYRFSYPVLVSLTGYCLFATTFTPTLYAQASFGGGRVENTSYFIWILITYVVMFYLIGWICRRTQAKMERDNDIPLISKTYIISIVLLFAIFTMLFVRKDTTIFVGTDAMYSLITGQAKQYKVENEERLKILYDETVTDAVFPGFTSAPSLLMFQDITSNPEEWLNVVVAEYYHKESVKRE